MDAIEQNKSTVTDFIDALFTKGDLGAGASLTGAQVSSTRGA